MTTQESLGFAILGAGMIADYYQSAIAANAQNGARLVAVGYHNPTRFAELSQRFGVPCQGLTELLANPAVDVVCIATPSGLHSQQALAAIAAGKHVLVEKPMALSLADADAMIAAAQAQNVRLGVSLQRRTEPLFQKVKRALDQGDLGDLTLAVVTMPYFRGEAYYAQAAWRGTWALDGGGVLMNQGIHIIDLLIWFLGDPISVQALGGTLHRSVEVEDTVGAVLRFANGGVATITATTTAQPGFPHRIELYGANGGIQIEGEGVTRWTLADPTRATVEPPELSGPADPGAAADPRGIKATGHIQVVRDFIHAIHTGADPAIDGHQGRRALATILEIYRAAGIYNGK